MDLGSLSLTRPSSIKDEVCDDMMNQSLHLLTFYHHDANQFCISPVSLLLSVNASRLSVLTPAGRPGRNQSSQARAGMIVSCVVWVLFVGIAVDQLADVFGYSFSREAGPEPEEGKRRVWSLNNHVLC